MKILLNNLNSEYLETISIENLDNADKTFKKFSSMKGPIEAKIFVINESITSVQLSKLFLNFDS